VYLRLEIIQNLKNLLVTFIKRKKILVKENNIKMIKILELMTNDNKFNLIKKKE